MRASQSPLPGPAAGGGADLGPAWDPPRGSDQNENTPGRGRPGAFSILILLLVESRGLEPLTYALRTHRSTN